MLSVQDKEQIYAEEVYRNQVRQQLQLSPAQRGRRLINSAFGVWLISALVIVAAAYGFSYASAEITTRHQQEQRIRQLDTELSARLALFREDSRRLDDAPFVNDEHGAPLRLAAGVYPQFAERTFRALLYELHAMVPATDRAELQRALHASDRWTQRYRLLMRRHAGQPGGLLQWRDQLDRELSLDPFNLPRWRQPFGQSTTH